MIIRRSKISQAKVRKYTQIIKVQLSHQSIKIHLKNTKYTDSFTSYVSYDSNLRGDAPLRLSLSLSVEQKEGRVIRTITLNNGLRTFDEVVFAHLMNGLRTFDEWSSHN